MKKYLVLIFLLISITSLAGVVVPIPIYTGGGGFSDSQALAILIASDILSALIYTVLTIVWLIKKRYEYTFYEYVIYSDTELLFTDLNTLYFLIMNGIGLLGIIAVYVEKFL